jgi:N-acetylglutamate synthase-like GNAT family acetyltransferase
VLSAASAGDLVAIEALLRENGLPTAGVGDSIGDFILARAGGDLIGVIGLERHAPYGLLRSAAVSKEWQGRGLGRALVVRLLEEALHTGISAIYLLTTTAEDYFPAFRFRRVSRESVPEELLASEEFRGACPDSAVVMVLALQDR